MIATPRLTLRRWQDRYRSAFHAQCADQRVMAYIGPVQTPAQVDAVIARHDAHYDRHGYCFFAIERRADGAMLGFCGLKPGADGTPLEGAVEIGWRLGFDHWGLGYAREAAAASLAWGFATQPIDRIGAITVQANRRSWGLMERLGMVRDDAADFDHPAVPDGSPLKRHMTWWAARP